MPSIVEAPLRGGMDSKSKFKRKKNKSKGATKGLTSAKQRAKKKNQLAKKKHGSAQKKRAKNKRKIPERNSGKKPNALCAALKALIGRGQDIVFEQDVMDIVELLNFTQPELNRLKIRFERVDIDQGGEVDYDEFMDLIQQNRSPFTDALMSLIDPEGTGIVSFQGFFQIVATYCMYSQEDILRFAFTTFDKDSSGTIDEDEFMDLCKTINNANPMFPANFKRALQEFDRNDDGLIDYDEFKQINRRYPMVLFPAFQIQDAMQRHVLGADFWKSKMRQKKQEEEIFEYQRTHGGAMPPVPLGKRIKRIICCCFVSSRVRTDKYEAPVKRTVKKRLKHNKVTDSGKKGRPGARKKKK